MELVSDIDEFLVRISSYGTGEASGQALIDSGLCSNALTADIFNTLYKKNPVRACLFLVTSRYPEMTVINDADKVLVIGRTAAKRAKFIMTELHDRYYRMALKRHKRIKAPAAKRCAVSKRV